MHLLLLQFLSGGGQFWIVSRRQTERFLTLTETAAREIKRAAKGSSGRTLRISPTISEGRAYRLTLEEAPESGDAVATARSVRIAVDKEDPETVRGVKVDYVERGDTKGFVVRRASGCGCGPGCGCG